MVDAGMVGRIVEIVVADVILAGDNAVVIALAVHRLPARERRLGILFGTGAAVALRVAFTILITLIMGVPLLIAAYGAFAEFLTRDAAIAVLLFVILYKLCDAFAGTMTAPFVIDLGFSRTDYANIVKGIGLAATLIGGFVGGFIARAYPLVSCLWLGAVLQMASNLVFTWLASIGLNHWALGAAIIAENFTGAIGTVIFVAYLSALCRSPLHTATQYALLTALAAIGRTYLSAGAGFIAEFTGWPLFFIVSSFTAAPSLALLWWLQMRGHFAPLQEAARKD